MEKKSIAYKILHFPLTKILVGSILVVSIYLLMCYGLGELFNFLTLTKEISSLLIALLSSMIAILVYVFLFKSYEKRKITELSADRITKNLFFGILLGALLQSLTILVMYLKGSFEIISVNSFLFLIPGLTMAFSSAIFEEILMRGVFFRLMEEKLGSVIALVISALLFGLLHLSNPNSSLLLALGLAIQAGLLLASAYIFTRSLWFPIAIHFAWNFTQSGIFGARVSGNTISKTLLTTKIEGPEWLTGGQFGPEGSIQATLFCLLATIILLILSKRQNKFIKPFWKK